MVRVLMENGFRYFACGGALGFDTFAATYICSLKQQGYDVKLVLMLPCRDQTAKWSDYSRRVYENILSPMRSFTSATAIIPAACRSVTARWWMRPPRASAI